MQQLEFNFGDDMTKLVRIENADTTPYKVVVEVWDKGIDGAPDKFVQEHHLDYPTAISSGLYLTSTRYLIVKEAR